MSLLQGARVLVVEDEILLSLNLETMLLDRGCVVAGSAGKLDDALQIAREPQSQSSTWPFSTSISAASAWTPWQKR
jgi:hypothetical protein